MTIGQGAGNFSFSLGHETSQGLIGKGSGQRSDTHVFLRSLRGLICAIEAARASSTGRLIFAVVIDRDCRSGSSHCGSPSPPTDSFVCVTDSSLTRSRSYGARGQSLSCSMLRRAAPLVCNALGSVRGVAIVLLLLILLKL